MKKEFMLMLLVVSIIRMPLTYAMEERTKEAVRFGNGAVCHWFVQGSKAFCKLMEVEPRPEFHLDNLNKLIESVGDKKLTNPTETV